MKHLQLIGLVAGAALFAGCESTETAGKGRQEAKRAAAVRQEQQQNEDKEIDESHRNLWNAQHDILTRDGNAVQHYY
jgi:hypothetical protein